MAGAVHNVVDRGGAIVVVSLAVILAQYLLAVFPMHVELVCGVVVCAHTPPPLAALLLVIISLLM